MRTKSLKLITVGVTLALGIGIGILWSMILFLECKKLNMAMSDTSFLIT